MSFQVKIIADSINAGPQPSRITTMELQYPRFILAEFNTHRVFSRSSASSRAIPVAKMIEQVENNPAMPVFWGKNQPGMQADEELDDDHIAEAKLVWKLAARDAIGHAQHLIDAGVHKQIANRLLEPWMWAKTIVTSTEWANFWDLRDHPAAQPEFRHLAGMMHQAYQDSIPTERDGDWHLPYITDAEREYFPVKVLTKFSTARCARVSYNNHDGSKPDYEKDMELHARLIGVHPRHSSPAEHQATPDVWGDGKWLTPELHGNFKGWRQYRQFVDQNKNWD